MVHVHSSRKWLENPQLSLKVNEDYEKIRVIINLIKLELYLKVILKTYSDYIAL